MDKKWLIIGGVIVIALGAVFFLSPSRNIEEKQIEKMVENAYRSETGKDINVEYTDDGVSFETEEGSMQTGSSVTLPTDFPADVFVIEGKLTASLKTNEQAYTVTVETKESLARVKELYQERMVSDGWSMTSTMNLGGTISLMGEKDTRALSVLATEEEGKTTVIVTVAKK